MFKFKHLFNKRNSFILGSLSIYPTYHYIVNNDNDNKIKKYSLDEVRKHNKNGDVWVTHNNKVYDISQFTKHHPGGEDKIMQAAGSSITPFWNIYKQHYNDNVTDILNEYYIGDLIESVIPIISIKKTDAYKNEPERSDKLQILKNEPFNGQPSLKELRNNYITPNELWYIRNHHPVPIIDSKDYKLKITTPLFTKEYSLNQLKKFDKKTLVNTIQCAGNRRKEFNNHEKVMGLDWNGGAISTGKFGGVYLRDLLSELFIDISAFDNINDGYDSTYHLQLIGYDKPFDGSIIIDKNINLLKDTMLAYEMNDKDLEKDHGYPLRIIVPGYSGAKNIKWLKEIKISNKESESSWQKGVAYKNFGPNIKTFEDIDEKDKINTPTVEKLPVQSFICDIKEEKDYIDIKGIAYSGGGNNIIRVDVSIDDGETWITSELNEGKQQKKYQAYAWTFWTAKIPIKNKKILNIICKATDINYNTQPQNSKDIWNLRGILNNSWHKVEYKIKT